MDAISTLFNAGLVPKLTSYFSVAYLAIFLPAAIVVYWLLPQKARRWFLLAAGYGFFWLISGKLTVFLLLATLSIYLFGLWLDKLNAKRKAEAKTAKDRAEKKQSKKLIDSSALGYFLCIRSTYRYASCAEIYSVFPGKCKLAYKGMRLFV